jgi:hypothetical protein
VIQLAGNLDPAGALVDIPAGWTATNAAALHRALKPVPPAQQLRALIDTGAEATCLDPAIIQMLGLPFESTVFSNMPATVGLGLSSIYAGSITVLHPSGNARQNLVVPEVGICELPLRTLNLDAVIGRDILNRLRFVYDGPAGTFVLEY